MIFYIKSRDPIYKVFLIFGVVQKTAAVWLDFSLEVLINGDERVKTDFFLIYAT